MPSRQPKIYSDNVADPISATPTPRACPRRLRMPELAASTRKSETPPSRKATAVLAFIVTAPGSTLFTHGTSDTHPTRTRNPSAADNRPATCDGVVRGRRSPETEESLVIHFQSTKLELRRAGAQIAALVDSRNPDMTAQSFSPIRCRRGAKLEPEANGETSADSQPAATNPGKNNSEGRIFRRLADGLLQHSEQPVETEVSPAGVQTLELGLHVGGYFGREHPGAGFHLERATLEIIDVVLEEEPTDVRGMVDIVDHFLGGGGIGLLAQEFVQSRGAREQVSPGRDRAVIELEFPA